MSTGIYSIGVSGVIAAQLNLLATENNVTNASTPGYTRQRAVQATNPAINTGVGSIGQGVHVQTIERMYDSYLTGQVNSAQTTLSGIQANYGQIKQIDNLLADPNAGLTPALQDFFSGVQQVASNPSLLSARESMISSANTLVNRFQSLDLRLSQISDQVNGKIQDAVTSINTYSTQIADLNQRIVVSEASYGQPANDLLDQRDSLINELNKLIQVSTSTNSNGSFNVFVGTGQQLVVGNQAMTMTAMAASADPSRIAVGLQTMTGSSMELPEQLITGGQLGGLVAFRNDSLDKATNELGRVAASVALTFNAQHALGMNLTGSANGDGSVFTGDFFDVSTLVPTVSANSHNTGNLVVSAQLTNPPPYGPELSDGNYYTNLTDSDYRLTYAGKNASNVDLYSLSRLSDNKAWAPDTLANLNTAVQGTEGFGLSVSGGANVGDSFLIQPTRNAAKNVSVNAVIAADPRTVAAAVPFRTAATSSNIGNGAISTGKTVPGFNVTLLRTNNITLTYNAASPTQLSFAGLAPTDKVVIKLPGAPEGAPVSPPVAYTQGMTISVDGMSFTLTGQPSNGDTFTLSLNTAATADGRNALALGQLQTKNTMAGAKATYQGAYAQLVASNGIKTRELKVTGDAQQAVLDQAQATRDSLSGVNLDEEAANMIRFQQAYQASSKLLEIGKTLFDTILQIR